MKVTYGGTIPSGTFKFHPYARAYFAQHDVQLNTARKKVVDKFIRGLVSNALWDKFDFIYIHALPTSVQSRTNVVIPTEADATVQGAPTFTANVGWSSSSVANHVRAAKTLDQYAKFTRNDAHFGFYVDVSSSQNAYSGGSEDTLNVLQPYNGTTARYRINQATQQSTTGGGDGSHIVARYGSTSNGYYYNGVANGNDTQASSAVGATNWNICNLGAGGTTPNTSPVRASHLGASLSSGQAATMSSLLNTLMTELDAVP
jgi:hypothetical protein